MKKNLIYNLELANTNTQNLEARQIKQYKTHLQL